ncbi:MAG: hypothetical protein PHE27_06940 [Alphaproteobacteria bacterium]|nr:hypothetical protein [Alphaproteobacteria bacterium]
MKKKRDKFYYTSSHDNDFPSRLYFDWSRLPEKAWKAFLAADAESTKCAVALLFKPGMFLSHSFLESKGFEVRNKYIDMDSDRPDAISYVTGLTTLENAFDLLKQSSISAVRVLGEVEQPASALAMIETMRDVAIYQDEKTGFGIFSKPSLGRSSSKRRSLNTPFPH